MKKITTDKEGYIQYNNKILLIKTEGERNNGENYFIFQLDGTMCLRYEDFGSIEKEFESDSKYFNPNYWYSLARWFIGENKLLFLKGKKKPNYALIDNCSSKEFDKKWEEVIKNYKQYTIPDKDVLSIILKEASKKLGIELTKTETEYGKDWYEAYIPLTINDENYTLTWMNCD